MHGRGADSLSVDIDAVLVGLVLRTRVDQAVGNDGRVAGRLRGGGW